MRLGEFLQARSRAGAMPAPTQPVTFKAIARDAHGDEYLVDCQAVLALVDESKRDQALDATESALRKKYPDGAVPDEKRRNEMAYQVLVRALRDAEEPRTQLATSVDELRAALVLPEASRLYAAYVAFLDEEFPATPTPEQFDELVEDAKKNSSSARPT